MTPQQISAQYRCAVEMARSVDDKGPFLLTVSEHHAPEDGYEPDDEHQRPCVARRIASYRIVTVADAVALLCKHSQLPLHPLCGGVPARTCAA